MLEQTSIYDFLPHEDDEILKKLQGVRNGQQCRIGPFLIYINDSSLYEIESSKHHECFKSIDAIYEFMVKEINTLGGGMNEFQ